MTYTQAAVERAMKVHEVLMQTTTGKRPGSGSSTGSGRRDTTLSARASARRTGGCTASWRCRR